MIFYVIEAQQKLGYNFKDVELLRQCFTHASYANEHKGEKNNERLEYLGDSVLGFVVSDYLYKTQVEDEGSMTFHKQTLVSTKPLADATRRLKIEKYLLLGGDGSLKISDKICENLFESVVAGIYLDGGLEEAKKFIYKNLLKNDIKANKVEDYKSKLNEYSSKNKLGGITYKLLSKTGTDHEPIFKTALIINGKQISVGEGSSKKLAEQQSAKIAYALLTKKNKKTDKKKC